VHLILTILLYVKNISYHPKITSTILKIYLKKIDYKRLEKENFINAIIDNITLILLLAFLGLNKQRFRQLQEGNLIPFINLKSVDYLKGLYYIKAAKEFLDDNN